jgi:cytochrome P450
MTVTYNPFEPGYIENPYPQLKALREADPVHRSPLEFWMLTRYEDINTVLRDTERFSVDHRKAAIQVIEELDPGFIPVILFRDPPDHTRLRKSLSKAMTPNTIENFRPRVRELVSELFDTIEEKGEVDWIAELANPLPYLTISEMLGMPVADRDQILRWTTDIVNITEPNMDPEVTKAIITSRDAMRVYLADLVRARRKEPADDIVSVLVNSEDGLMSDDEMVDHIMLLHVSAHEPTGNHLGHGLLALLRHPDQAAMLRDDPSLDNHAVEEMLRYEAPLQLTGRFTLEEVEIDGHTVTKGTPVVMSLAAANHDPAHWGPTADELDLKRPRAHEHLSFARGVHTCFGSALARLQGQEVFGRFVRRFPNARLTAEPTWNNRLNGRGPAEMQVAVGA